MSDELDKIVDLFDCTGRGDKLFFYESFPGHIEDSIFKKIFLAEPLENDINTILHENLWDLYEEIFVEELVDNKISTCEYGKEITMTLPKAADDISWDVTLEPIEYDSEETRVILENINWNNCRVVVTGQERILKTGYNEYTSMMDKGVDEDKLTEKKTDL